MPVSIALTDHRIVSKDFDPVNAVTPPQILEGACPDRYKQADTILQYSIGGWTQAGGRGAKFKIDPNGCGFVNTVLSAYTGSYALVLRPDDVWLTVISQFSLYVNANPELLRDHIDFVPQTGERRPLAIVDPNSPPLSTQMGELMQRNLLDHPALREWILPNFSTSTPNDSAVVSLLWMAPTVKKVSLPGTETRCRGIPRITLEGLRTDWELILHKLEKLKEYGIPAIAWYHLLHPVVSQITDAFYNPNDNAPIREFWSRVVHGVGFGGRDPNLSGWITAFCFFSCDGQWHIPQLRTTRVGKRDPATLPSRLFWSAYASLEETSFNMTIADVKYPHIYIHDLPAGYAEVNVTANHGGIAAPCVLVAGLTGVGYSSSRDPRRSSTGRNDTVRPVVAWWMFSKLAQAQPLQSHEHEPDIVLPLVLTTVLPQCGDGPALDDGNPVPPPFVLAESA
ncbi:hypothetical protein GGX14DRAFT_457715 [Mycena pura]|uniref:Uncharacterized protein n=1 Tax=Mycena pura TaxID=153505 RepID=A0AAD6V8Z0_9AGAR|nr:hypothetical protein GGX14DRAFT_457715 [Mycena pura]